jgi:hypothetical protein
MAGQTGYITMSDEAFSPSNHAFKLGNDMGGPALYQNHIGDPQVSLIGATTVRFEEKGSKKVVCYGQYGRALPGDKPCEYNLAPRETVFVANRSKTGLTLNTDSVGSLANTYVGPSQVAHVTCSASTKVCRVTSVTPL